MIRILAVLLILIAPACSWTDDDVVYAMTISLSAGQFREMAYQYEFSYNNGQMTTANYHDSIIECNKWINRYNEYLQDHFNSAVYNSKKIKEF